VSNSAIDVVVEGEVKLENLGKQESDRTPPWRWELAFFLSKGNRENPLSSDATKQRRYIIKEIRGGVRDTLT